MNRTREAPVSPFGMVSGEMAGTEGLGKVASPDIEDVAEGSAAP